MRFCAHCGEVLSQRHVEGRLRYVCTGCDRIAYRQLKTGAGVIVTQDGRLLLMRRGDSVEGFPSTWCLPAGYCEVDESPMQTAVRETKEETGLDVEIGSLFGLFHYMDDPRGNGILILYHATVTDGELAWDGEEVSALATFAPAELPTALAGAGQDVAIHTWRREAMARADE